VNRDILSLARQAGFVELESEDIEELLASHTEKLTNEDLQLLTEHCPLTVSTIIKKALDVKAGAQNVTPFSALRLGWKHEPIMDRMERLLQKRIQDQTRCHLPLSTVIIMAKASNIWVMLKAESSESSASDVPFKASPGLFQWLKRHANLHNLRLTASFQEFNKGNVAEVLESHSEELSTKDLLLLEQQQRVEESTGEEDNHASMTLTVKMLSTTLDHVDSAMEVLAENDPNLNRSSSVRALVVKGILCYKELYLKRKKKVHQTTITSFFKLLL
ncbi:Tigger transposable element-derived protein 1-like 140, partial [Homarus americanus]